MKGMALTDLGQMNPRVPAAVGTAEPLPTIICLSHLRWDFVWQRPQQLLSRFARTRRVIFVEEPIFETSAGLAPEGGVFRLNREPVGVPPATERAGIVTAQPICRDPGVGGGPVLDEMYAFLLKQRMQRSIDHGANTLLSPDGDHMRATSRSERS